MLSEHLAEFEAITGAHIGLFLRVRFLRVFFPLRGFVQFFDDKGGGPLLTDLLGGQVPVSFNVVSEVLPHIKSGKLRALGVTSPTRWRGMSETPTLAELGYRDITFVEWLGWFAPTGTPVARLNALNAAVNSQLGAPAMAEVFERNALEPLGGTPAALTELVRRDHDYWQRVVKATGFTPEE